MRKETARGTRRANRADHAPPRVATHGESWARARHGPPVGRAAHAPRGARRVRADDPNPNPGRGECALTKTRLRARAGGDRGPWSRV
eukprot:6177476-Pleurochrysis_carterae.AAC.2